MPKAVSKKQLRFMYAVKNNPNFKGTGRGVPPKGIAENYTNQTSDSKNLPEQHGDNRGGTWNGEVHTKWKGKVSEKRDKKKVDNKAKKTKGRERKANLKKAFEQLYKGKGAGVIVVNKDGQILVGKQPNGQWSTPGGHVENGEDFKTAAIRELKEETGLSGSNPVEVHSARYEGNDAKIFFISSYKGKLSNKKDPDNEYKKLKFMPVQDIPWNKMRGCSKDALYHFFKQRLNKSNKLQDMLVIEELEKNIDRHAAMGPGEAVFQVTHGDALSLVGNGAFRMLREATRGMGDEDFRDIKLDDYVVSIRKHVNDVYSGRIVQGHKMIHQFANKSLPQLTAELMSIFEWYLPEDEKELEILNDIDDEAIEGGLNELIDNYKRHNLADIYTEMENIREEIRHSNTVDLQQIEQRVMKLFDKLNSYIHEIARKHNDLAERAGNDLDMVENKLIELQHKIDKLNNSPVAVNAVASNPVRHHQQLLDTDYCYLSKPIIEIAPSGKIRIIFNNDWQHLDQENFLNDMKAKVITKARLDD